MNYVEDSSGGRIKLYRRLLSAFLTFCLFGTILQSQANAAGDVISVEITSGASSKTFEAFDPNPINIDAGDTVVWTNNDVTPHTVTSGAAGTPDGNFDSSPGLNSLLVSQATFSHTFSEAGNYPYYCGLHPNMVGTIIVGGGSNVFGKIEVPPHVSENVGFPLSIIDNDLNVDPDDPDVYSFLIGAGEMTTAKVLLAGESALEIRVNDQVVTMTNALSIPFEETGDDTGIFVPDLQNNEIDTSMFTSDEEGPIEDGDIIDFVYSELAYEEVLVSTTVVGTKIRTHLTLNPIESVVPNSNITVSGILRDLENWTGLSGRNVTISGSGVPSQQIATTAGIVFEGLMEIRTCETQLPPNTPDGSDTQTIDDDVYPECLQDEGDIDGVNSVLHLNTPSAGPGGTIKFPPGITNVVLQLQNMGTNQVTVGIEHATGPPSTATSIGYCPDVADFNLISSREIRQIKVLEVASDPSSNSIFPHCNTPGDQTVGISRIETSNIDGNPEARYVFDFEDMLPGSLPNQIELGAGSFYATFEAPSTVQDELNVQASFGGDNLYLLTLPKNQSYNTIKPTVDLAAGGGGHPTSGIVPDTGVGITTISCILDNDKDGLCNSWESTGLSTGVPYKVGSTTNYYTLDITKLHLDDPDIWVEIDYMGDDPATSGVNESHRPNDAALLDVKDAFQNTDPLNPIYLHYFIDDELQHEGALNVWLDTDQNPNNDFFKIKQSNFGTDAERSQNSNPLTSNNLLKAKSQVYHYALFAHSIGTCPLDTDPNGEGTPSGFAELNGNDFIVSLGCGFGPDDSDPNTHSVGTQNEQAGTFMHELGHNLGLDHGGPREFLQLPTGYAISGTQVNTKVDYAAGDSSRSLTIRNLKVVTAGPSSGTLMITATVPLSPNPGTVNVGTVTRSYNPAYPIIVDSITPIVSEHSGGAATVRQISLKVDYRTTATTTATTGDLGTFTIPFTVTNTASVLGNPTTPGGTPILSIDISSTDYTENCKPNYPSVMSYSQQFSTYYDGNTYVWSPRYSNWIGQDLNEAHLNENIGLGGNPNYIIFHNGEAVRMASTTDPQVDWSATAVGSDVPQNINNLGGAGDGCVSQTLNVLKGFDDWNNLNFNFKKGLASIDGVYPANSINVFWREGTFTVLVDKRQGESGGGGGGSSVGGVGPLTIIIGVAAAGAGVLALYEYQRIQKRKYLNK